MFSTGAPSRRTNSTLGADFHRLWASVTISSLGDGMRFVALPLLATGLTTDPRRVAAVAMAEQLPFFLLALFAGALADRLDRRRILWLVDAVRTVLVGALALAVAAHAVTIPLLIAAGFLLGCGQTLYNGGWSGMVPTIVAPADLTRANSRIQAAALITDTLLGTPLGAVLFGLAAALPFAVDSASFAAAALLAFLLRGDFRPSTRTTTSSSPIRSLRGDVADGVRWLWQHHALRRLCLLSGLANLVGAGLTAVLVLYAHQALELSDLGFALLVASFALGGVTGALLTPRLTGRLGVGRLLRGTVLTTAAAAALLGWTHSGLFAAGGIALYGAASISWGIATVSLRQRLVPTALLGRVTMAHQMVYGAGLTLGAAIAGFLASAGGIRLPFYAGALLLAVIALVPTRIPSTPTPAPATSPSPAPAAAEEPA
ncbi:MFS transporter [Kitasatospora sp. MMS16-BH015]|uniref:MFS transporter n=1 Tax=Kitasatospora sp. MMS16-BH015 TaxID=2018025 RepID=UPI000CA2F067|nr:MFS transporter [Kitasatospora sp. MMS16-BH015]AUG80735.1 MFS transporter [Kitasatospora sp. MMS16-BH015]